MRKAKPEDFEGKTIQSVNLNSANMWTFKFTDGTEIDIWSECEGPYSIPCLFVEQPWFDEDEDEV